MIHGGAEGQEALCAGCMLPPCCWTPLTRMETWVARLWCPLLCFLAKLLEQLCRGWSLLFPERPPSRRSPLNDCCAEQPLQGTLGGPWQIRAGARWQQASWKQNSSFLGGNALPRCAQQAASVSGQWEVNWSLGDAVQVTLKGRPLTADLNGDPS